MSRPVSTQRQVMLSLAISAYFLSYAFRVAPSTLSVQLATSFHANASAMGLMSSAYFWVTVLIQIPAGMLSDRLGPRRLITGGCAVLGMGALLFGVTEIYAWAVCARILIGLGASVLFVSMIKLVAVHYPPERFATITGLGMLLGASGSVAAGAPLAWGAAYFGWRELSLFFGVVTFVVGVLSWFNMADTRPRRGEDIKRLGDSPPWHRTALDLLELHQIRLGFMVNLGFTGSFMSFSGLWMGSILVQAKGLSLADSGLYSSLFFMAFAIGSQIIGRLSDVSGSRRTLIILTGFSFLIAMTGLTQPAITSGYPLAINLLIMGLSASGFTLSWACAKDAAPATSAGLAVSVVNTGGFLGAALLQQLGGLIMDRHRLQADDFSAYDARDFQLCLWLHMGVLLIGLLAATGLRDKASEQASATAGSRPKG